MKRTILKLTLTLTAIISLSISYAQAQQTNFSGKWLINESQSSFGNRDKLAVFKQLDIKQSTAQLDVTGTRFDDVPAGTDKSTNTKYITDGSKQTSILPNKRTMTATVNWSKDGKTITRSSDYSEPNDPDTKSYESKEVWSLSADGRHLTLDRTINYSAGEPTVIKAIYDKQ